MATISNRLLYDPNIKLNNPTPEKIKYIAYHRFFCYDVNEGMILLYPYSSLGERVIVFIFLWLLSMLHGLIDTKKARVRLLPLWSSFPQIEHVKDIETDTAKQIEDEGNYPERSRFHWAKMFFSALPSGSNQYIRI